MTGMHEKTKEITGQRMRFSTGYIHGKKGTVAIEKKKR